MPKILSHIRHNGANYLPRKSEFSARNNVAQELTMCLAVSRKSMMDLSIVVVSIVSQYQHKT